MRSSVAILSVIVLTALAAAGCGASFHVKNPFPDKPKPEADTASYAAAKEYPTAVATNEVRVTAVIDRQTRSVLLVNPSDDDYYGLRAWVNGKYVAWVNELPARRTVRLTQGQFVDADQKPLSVLDTDVAKVELQTNGDFYRAMGPAVEPAEGDKPRRGVEFSFPPKRNAAEARGN